MVCTLSNGFNTTGKRNALNNDNYINCIISKKYFLVKSNYIQIWLCDKLAFVIIKLSCFFTTRLLRFLERESPLIAITWNSVFYDGENYFEVECKEA